MRIRPRFKNTGISFEGVCLCLYVWNPFFCFSLFWPTYAPLHRHQTAHMGLEEDRCVAQGHFQQILADKDALKSSILQSKGHPAACKCVWPPLRNVEYLSTRESFVCVFACACKSPAPFTQLGGSPSHVSHYRLADNVIGDTKQSVAFRPDKSDKYTPHICFKDVWRWLPLATNKEVRRRNGKEEGGEDCWIKKSTSVHIWVWFKLNYMISHFPKGYTIICLEIPLTSECAVCAGMLFWKQPDGILDKASRKEQLWTVVTL